MENLIYVITNPYGNIEGVFIDEIQAKNYLISNYCKDYKITGINSNIKQVINAQQYEINYLKKQLEKQNRILLIQEEGEK